MTAPLAALQPRIVIAGGSGFIGQALATRFIEQRHDVVVLTRNAGARTDGVREVAWNARTLSDWATELDGAAAVINLTGKSINSRHTENNRREIISSRVDSVRVIAEAITACDAPPPVWVQASAVGIYGDAGDALCDESSPHGNDFMAQVCERWEDAFRTALTPATRGVVLRFGVVQAQHRYRGPQYVHRRALQICLQEIDHLGRQSIIREQFRLQAVQLGFLRKVALPQKPDHFFEGGFRRQRVDIVATVTQDACVAIDITNFGFAGDDAFKTGSSGGCGGAHEVSVFPFLKK